jgi:hypothetical protein
LSEEPKDWDICLSTEKTRDEVREHFTKYQNSVVCITDNAITLKGGFQIVLCKFAPPEVMATKFFDFVHTKGWFSFKGHKGNLFIPEDVWMSCRTKRLIPKLPIEQMSAERIQRFLKRGWTLDHGELEGLKALAEADLGDGQNVHGQKLFDSWGS